MAGDNLRLPEFAGVGDVYVVVGFQVALVVFVANIVTLIHLETVVDVEPLVVVNLKLGTHGKTPAAYVLLEGYVVRQEVRHSIAGIYGVV